MEMYIVFCRNTECIWIFYSDLLAEKSPMSLNLGSKSMFRLLWWCRTSDWCDVCVRLHITRVLTFDAVVTIFRGCLWAIPSPSFLTIKAELSPRSHTYTHRGSTPLNGTVVAVCWPVVKRTVLCVHSITREGLDTDWLLPSKVWLS